MVVAEDAGPRRRGRQRHLSQRGHAAPRAEDVHGADGGGPHQVGLPHPQPGPVQVLERPAPEPDLTGDEQQLEGDEPVPELLEAISLLLEHLHELLHRVGVP